jgi:hypothetical protein
VFGVYAPIHGGVYLRQFEAPVFPLRGRLEWSCRKFASSSHGQHGFRPNFQEVSDGFSVHPRFALWA